MFDSMDLNSLLPRSVSQSDEDEEESCIPSLSWRERLIGCVSCMIFGYILSFGAFFRIKALMLGNPMPFVVNATVGNIIALCGSCFISGPHAQSKKMFHETRKVATIAYLSSLCLTLLVAFLPVPGKKFVLLPCMLVQYVAIAWYCLSYIPFARQAIIGYCQRFVSDEG